MKMFVGITVCVLDWEGEEGEGGVSRSELIQCRFSTDSLTGD